MTNADLARREKPCPTCGGKGEIRGKTRNGCLRGGDMSDNRDVFEKIASELNSITLWLFIIAICQIAQCIKH